MSVTLDSFMASVAFLMRACAFFDNKFIGEKYRLKSDLFIRHLHHNHSNKVKIFLKKKAYKKFAKRGSRNYHFKILKRDTAIFGFQ